jgi:ABC-type transport system involved in cytochrome c biogenesis permease subunit
MFAYAVFGVATLMAIFLLVKEKNNNFQLSTINSQLDDLVYVGLAFMTFGMLFGALWAKEAWGHYWSWDPKETWAAITWFAYLIYIHYRQLPKHKPRLALWLLIISFMLLQMCWWGINYLPSAQGASVHTYST